MFFPKKYPHLKMLVSNNQAVPSALYITSFTTIILQACYIPTYVGYDMYIYNPWPPRLALSSKHRRLPARCQWSQYVDRTSPPPYLRGPNIFDDLVWPVSRVVKTMPFAPSPSHHHFYRCYGYHSQMHGWLLLKPHYLFYVKTKWWLVRCGKRWNCRKVRDARKLLG